MSKHPNRFVFSLIGWIVVAGLAAGLAYVLGGGKPSGTVMPAPSSATSTALDASSTRVLLAVPAPNAASDQLFVLTLSDQTVSEQQTAPGWRLTRLASDQATLTIQEKADGAAVLGNGSDWNVPLRTRGGAAYQDVSLLGRFDGTHAALLATRDDQRYLLSVSRTGEVRELYAVPDNSQLISFDAPPAGGGAGGGGNAWFVTAEPGEGIESPPTGPSSLIRVTASGLAAVVATDTRLMIAATGHGPDGFAYATESGDLVIQSGATTTRDTGRPLVWLDGRRLLYARGTTVLVFDATRDASTPVTDLPAAPAVAVIAQP